MQTEPTTSITRDSGARKRSATAGMDKVIRRSVFVMAVIVFAASCDSTTPSPTAVAKAGDRTPPRIVSTFPANGATGVPQNITIKIAFSELMSERTLQPVAFGSGWAFQRETIFGWSATYETAANTQSFPVHLKSLYTYTVVVGNNGLGATDTAYNFLAKPNSFTFTTLDGGQPRAVSTDPEYSATGVDPTKPIRVTFSEALDPATVGRETFVVSSGSPVAGIVTYDSATFSAIFTPSVPLRSATQYAVTLAVIRDVSGVVMEGDFNFFFTTR